MAESPERFDYFIGGHLDGVSLPFNEHAQPVMTEIEEGHVYSRQPIFDDDTRRVWVHITDPSEIIAALPEITQSPAPGTKELTIGDLASFVLVAQRCGFSRSTKVRGLMTWLGFVRELRAHRRDDPTHASAEADPAE